MENLNRQIWVDTEPLWWRKCHDNIMESKVLYFGVYSELNNDSLVEFIKTVLS